MTQAAHEWVRRLSAEPLPVLRRTLTRVRELLNSSSVNHGRLAEIISADPGFSLHLMQRLGALPNAPREPVGKISHAVSLLGMSLIGQAIRSLPCLEERLTGAPLGGLLDCYSRSAHAAIYAGGIAAMRGDQDTGTLSTAALLHDLGEMALWSREPERMLQIRQRIREGDGRDDAAMEVLGCTLEEINIDLSEHWRLPELVSTAQGMANSYLPRPLGVMLSCALARESGLGWMRHQTLDHVELLAEFLDIPFDLALSRLHRLSAEAARQLASLPYPLPAYHLICVANPAPARKQAVVRETGHSATAGPPQTNPLDTREGGQANTLHQTITRALLEMRQGLGLQRAMFAMLNNEKTRLKARLVAEAPSDHPLKAFNVELTEPTLFSMLMQKPQAFALNPRNIDRYLDLIPPEIARMIGENGFLAMSVFLRNNAVGLFYADNGSDEAASERQYDEFKAICLRIIRSLV